MRRTIIFIMGFFVSCLLLVPANAALIDRGTGMIYDTDLGITWLQDANYAQTSGYDADGRMTWNQATNWATKLNINGITGWRLPSTVDGPASGFEYDGTTFSGYNITTSDMGHLFYITLGNKGYRDVNGGYVSGYGLMNKGPFVNLTPDSYWSGTEYSLNTNYAWDFYFGSGAQGEAGKENGLRVLAVRDGDTGPSASVGNPYNTTMVLGRTISFDYWWEMGQEPEGFNLDILFLDGGEWKSLFGWKFNLDGSSTDWLTASFMVPEYLRGLETQIRFQVFDFGANTDPTVYLNNIASSTAPVPEPSTMLLLASGLVGLAGLRKSFRKNTD